MVGSCRHSVCNPFKVITLLAFVYKTGITSFAYLLPVVQKRQIYCAPLLLPLLVDCGVAVPSFEEFDEVSMPLASFSA